MPKRKKRRYNKQKGKIKVKNNARIRKKSEHTNDSVTPTKNILNDNGATFKIKIRKKK